MKHFLLFILLSFCSSAFADFNQTDTQRYQTLTSELRCLVCQNENLSDSTAPLAMDLKHQVQTMIAEGKSNEAILDYLTTRYGEFVLFKPSVSPKNYLLWFGPFILLVFAVAILIIVLVLRRRETKNVIKLTEEEKQKLQELLK
ncbi:MAG: cytochrome c-type biosis protein CycL [Gammaproteobacteria bacterium]|jgi:cytochrome c-type biogenesis protein CcmH|nr:cytochrome c-type biosis protein CycL [Gammaproteobacteria bacterium]